MYNANCTILLEQILLEHINNCIMEDQISDRGHLACDLQYGGTHTMRHNYVSQDATPFTSRNLYYLVSYFLNSTEVTMVTLIMVRLCVTAEDVYYRFP